MPDLPKPPVSIREALDKLTSVACDAMNRLSVLREDELANRLCDAIELSQEARDGCSGEECDGS